MRLFAVSRDSPYSHKRYAEQQWLTYPLLSDWTAAAVRAFGVNQTLDGLEDTPVLPDGSRAGGNEELIRAAVV